MTSDKTTIVDFIARGDTDDEWRMVLVEEGPWLGPVADQLHRIQERLYACIDAAIDGHLAEKFPESKGKNIVLRLDCYNLPRDEVAEFFNKFSSGVFLMRDYAKSLRESKNVRKFRFELNFDSIH